MAFEIQNRTTYPWDTIVYVSVLYTNKQTGRPTAVIDPEIGDVVTGAHATGVVVGRNDVLTAAHVVQTPAWLDPARYGIKVVVYPGADDSPFTTPFGSYTAASWSNYEVATKAGTISPEQSQYDFALLSFSSPLGDLLGWMDLDPGNRNASGTANETGYAGNGPGMMNASVAYIRDFQFSVYHTSENLGVGSSGGPLWYADSTGTYVLGVASSGTETTASYASLAAPGVMNWLTGQIAANDTLIAATTGNTVRLSEPGAIATSALAVFSPAGTTGRNDIFVVAAANLPVLTLDGDAGTDILRVTGGGLVDLNRISSFEVLDLRSTLVANTVINMGADFHTVYLGPRGDSVTLASSGASTVTGGEGNDTIVVASGDASIDGGAGIDTVVLPLARAKYQIGKPSAPPATPPAGPTYTMTGVERMQFADKTLAFDLLGNAGNAAKIIGAAFGPDRLEPVLSGIGIRLFDQGRSIHDAAEIALGSDLFQQIAGSRSDAAVVQTIYNNVVGHAPSPAEVRNYLGALQDGTSQADLLAIAAGTVLNAIHIDLVGLLNSGLEYV